MAYLNRPEDFQVQCRFCGKWTKGQFAGRSDVPLEEADALFSAIMERPVHGTERPAPKPPHHTLYDAAEAQNYSGGVCDDCVTGKRGTHPRRLARLRAAMARPQPTEAQARDFFMAPPEEEAPPAARKRARRVMAKPQEQPQAPTGTDDGEAS